MKEVILDQRPASGQVWIRIVWQTGAVSEHQIRRNVNSYRNYAERSNHGFATSPPRRKWTTKSQGRSTRKAFCLRTDDRSAAMRFICCANAGIYQR